jgi:hypothetical protein
MQHRMLARAGYGNLQCRHLAPENRTIWRILRLWRSCGGGLRSFIRHNLAGCLLSFRLRLYRWKPPKMCRAFLWQTIRPDEVHMFSVCSIQYIYVEVMLITIQKHPSFIYACLSVYCFHINWKPINQVPESVEIHGVSTYVKTYRNPSRSIL